MAKKATTTKEEVVEIKSVKADLPKEIFEVPMNSDLIHQVMTSQMGNRRKVIAHAKGRAEVSGGGIKPWKQKGTGRARSGSNTSSIWVGGGVSHGPTKDRNFKKVLPKNIKRKALFVALSDKAREGMFVVTETLQLKEGKTKEARELLKNIGIKQSCLVVLSKVDKNIILAMRNLPKISTIQAKDLNCLDVISSKYILTDKDGIEEIKKTFLD
ncbi:50S ribosomal protein L4 [bacterium]|jgi:large subunit ribosomal protein L4|nr:50S ribosomal protein L4 [bacterium]